MLPVCKKDLWEYLQGTSKKIVLYGMGNGADKILAVCHQKGIDVSAVFASDGFVRKKLFHGMPVRSWGEIKEELGAQNVIVLLAFGSSRPEVLENISKISMETELYAPDVPAFGDGVFDRSFFEAHREELEAARELFSDEESLRIFDHVLQFKLTGRIEHLFAAQSDEERIWEELVRPASLGTAADLGAYNGDTVRELLEKSRGSVERIWAVEPDEKNYQKLCAYAKGETRAEVIPCHFGAWSERTELFFGKSGNRNASFGQNRSSTLEERPVKLTRVQADTLDSLLVGQRVDYIKYDVEGSEKEALIGSAQTIHAFHPTLLVSLYHRNEDIFALPLLVKQMFPFYKGFCLRRLSGIPAWDLNLYVREE